MINLPASSNQEVTITSLDFLNNYINPARVAAGEPSVSKQAFLIRVEDELENEGLRDVKINITEEINNLGFAVSRKTKYYDLTHDQMMLVGMRESKAVRKAVLSKLKLLLKPQQPSWLVSLSPEAQIAIADIDRQRLEAIATKAEIGSRREATAMNTASRLSKENKALQSKLQDIGTHKSLIAAKIDKYVVIGGKNKSVATIMKKLSSEMNHEIVKVEDARYGFANTYHIDVIEAFKSEYL